MALPKTGGYFDEVLTGMKWVNADIYVGKTRKFPDTGGRNKLLSMYSELRYLRWNPVAFVQRTGSFHPAIDDQPP